MQHCLLCLLLTALPECADKVYHEIKARARTVILTNTVAAPAHSSEPSLRSMHPQAAADLRVVCADKVYHEIKARARTGILTNMEREREGDQIDRALLKNTLEIFQEVRCAGACSQTLVEVVGQQRLQVG